MKDSGERRKIESVTDVGRYVEFTDEETGERDEMDLMTFKHLHEKVEDADG
jgi:hypothetical protein